MSRRSIALIAASLFIAPMLGCSALRPKRPLTWHITLEVDHLFSDPEATTRQTIDLIESRLNAFGVPNFEVTQQRGRGSVARIIVNLPEVQDRERVKNVITTGGKLEVDAVVSPPHPEPAKTYKSREEALASLDSGKTEPPNRRILVYPHDESGVLQKDWVVVELPVLVDGSELRNAAALPESAGSSNYSIQFSLKKSGASRLGDWTAANINRYLAVALNDQVLSIAFVRSQITDQGVISGRFSKASAEDLALVLKSGAYPGPVRFVEEGDNK